MDVAKCLQLGTSSAKMPTMGQPSFGGMPRAARNECIYLKLSEEIAEDRTASGPVNTESNSRNGSDPNWVQNYSSESNQLNNNVRETLKSLAIGSSSTIYDNFNSTNSNANSGSSYNGADSGLSPDSSSNRPTPNSTTPSETRPTNLKSKHPKSGIPSQGASPAVPMGHFFPGETDFSNTITSSGMTPDNTFSMPETPGRGFEVPSWDMENSNTTGLTPVGEGMFRHLMGLGPLDPM